MLRPQRRTMDVRRCHYCTAVRSSTTRAVAHAHSGPVHAHNSCGGHATPTAATAALGTHLPEQQDDGDEKELGEAGSHGSGWFGPGGAVWTVLTEA